MSSDTTLRSDKRPTTRQIAAKAGVSNATVSLALRNSPLTSITTRQRIHRIAEQLGYRPDPDVAKLMHHLRQRNKPRFKSVIVGLTTLPETGEQWYMQQIWAGVCQRAESLGYGANLVRVRPSDMTRNGFLRTLRNRGVEGIVLLPQPHALRLEALPAWDWFSVIVTTHGILHPNFHRVVPDQFGNTLLLCRKLEDLGCRRIGLLMPRESDLILDHRISGAIGWQNMLGDTEPVAPFVYEDDLGPKLVTWFKREHPDALIVGTEEQAHRVARLVGLSIPGRVAFGIVDSRAPHPLPGIDQRAFEIGVAATTVLNGLLVGGERGIPATRQVTMIQGAWHAGSAAVK